MWWRSALRLGRVLGLTALASTPVAAQSDPISQSEPRPAVASARASTAPLLDGRLDDAAWASALPATDFRQREPSEGAHATQCTEVRILFDDHALYVGARMHDDKGGRGVSTRLVRRDAPMESDYLALQFDTYLDRLGSASFRVNPSGVKGESLNNDASWDPVWEVATRIDSLGWTAELRIPFSQLRFPATPNQLWGLQVERQVTRLNELSMWSFWRQTETGGPSRFGLLEGLQISRRPARAELLPYFVGQASRLAATDRNDPFYNATSGAYRVGLDLKYQLTSNLTLSATLNPDFGQVEVDPAVVNLSAFETFYPERRPFFVEGSSYFGFSPLWCMFCSNVSSLGMFYSRRVGRAPQGSALAHDAGEYAAVPRNTTILGAAKVTGKTRSGWSLGVLNAVTGEEAATVVSGGERSRLPVEPRSNYFVGRVTRELRGGNTVVGGIATSTHRDLPTRALAEQLSRSASGVGVDANHWWGQRTYHLLFGAALSGVSGDSASVGRLQRSSARYYQRPDRKHGNNGLFSDAFEPGLESLRGYGIYSRLAKDAGAWRWEAAANLRSPGFEVNDIAFLNRADFIWQNANLQRQFTRPTRVYRRLTLVAGGQQQFNFDGDLTERQLHAYAGGQLANYWEASTYHIQQLHAYDDRLTRGGPVVRRVGRWSQHLSVSTDSRRKFVLATNPSYGRDAVGNERYALNLDVRYRPVSNVSLSLGPAYSYASDPYQYVTARDDSTAVAFSGTRYVFGDLDQRTLSLQTSASVIFSPTLSLEVFAQPLISSRRYTEFTEFTAPRTATRQRFGKDVGRLDLIGTDADQSYRLDPDGDGPAAELLYDNPDFNFRSLRGNAVLRWEYRPGSSAFLVWTQDRSATGHFGDLRFQRDSRALLAAPTNNIFLIKLNYLVGL